MSFLRRLALVVILMVLCLQVKLGCGAKEFVELLAINLGMLYIVHSNPNL